MSKRKQEQLKKRRSRNGDCRTELNSTIFDGSYDTTSEEVKNQAEIT